MKNENKIIDLLTEYIGKTDRMEREFMEEITFLRKEQLKLHEEQVKMNKEQVNLNKEQVNLNKELVKHGKDMKQVNTRQEVLMKEILSLSKRVIDLEDQDN